MPSDRRTGCLAALIRLEGGVNSTALELFKGGFRSVDEAQKANVDPSDLERQPGGNAAPAPKGTRRWPELRSGKGRL